MKENIEISKFLSLVLRHKPEELGIILDEAGWTDVATLLHKLQERGMDVSEEYVHHIVETNSKKRFAFNDTKDKIRASQGHSVEVELGLQAVTPPDILYHGTAENNVPSILEKGLEKRSRNHVHLSTDVETAIKVGQRPGKPIVLTILAEKMVKSGCNFYLSENNDSLAMPYRCFQYLKNDMSDLLCTTFEISHQ